MKTTPPRPSNAEPARLTRPEPAPRRRRHLARALAGLAAVAVGGLAVAVLFAAGGPFRQTPAAAQATGVDVGQTAPDFTLRDQDGQRHRLQSLRGKIVVLEWTNPQCPFVKRHYDADTMTDLAADLPGDQVVWMAIDSSNFITPAASRRWRAAESIPYPILQDPSGEVGRRYGARTTPHMFVIDGQGKVRYAGAIDDDAYGRDDDPDNHVADAVRALLAGRAPNPSSTTPYGCSVKYAD